MNQRFKHKEKLLDITQNSGNYLIRHGWYTKNRAESCTGNVDN